MELVPPWVIKIIIDDVIQAKQVAIANARLYVNKAEGFIGTGLKKW